MYCTGPVLPCEPSLYAYTPWLQPAGMRKLAVEADALKTVAAVKVRLCVPAVVGSPLLIGAT